MTGLLVAIAALLPVGPGMPPWAHERPADVRCVRTVNGARITAPRGPWSPARAAVAAHRCQRPAPWDQPTGTVPAGWAS